MEVFKFIDAEKATFPIAFMCGRLGVSTAGYYAWKDRPLGRRAIADRRITDLIHQIHAGSRGTYGAPESMLNWLTNTASGGVENV